MKKKEIVISKFKTCFAVLTVLILSGCSTPKKESRLVDIQRSRIEILQKELDKKEQLISDLKAQDWMRRPIVQDERIALKKLSQLVRQKKWALALKESSRLKKNYSQSVALRTYRYKIFKRLGFASKASQERAIIQNMMARSEQSRKASQTK